MKDSDFWTKLTEILIRQSEQQMSESNKSNYSDTVDSPIKAEATVSKMKQNENSVTYITRPTTR